MTLLSVIGTLLAIVGSGLIVGGWRECRLARRTGRLATQGVYALMRHPQYSGALMALLGIAMTRLPLLNALLVVAPLAFIAVRQSQFEDRHLFARFGEVHRSYRIRVAACMPRRVRWQAVLASLANGS